MDFNNNRIFYIISYSLSPMQRNTLLRKLLFYVKLRSVPLFLAYISTQPLLKNTT